MAEQVIVIKNNQTEDFDVKPLQDVVCGSHIQEFLDYQKFQSDLDDIGVCNIRNSTCDILSYCNPHDAVTNIPTTHLVVGYVQSGKTMSFTSLIELALDNKYKVVIVLAGITTNLLDQTDDRLGDDLVCGKDKNYRFFKIHKNPNASDASEICRNLKMGNTIVVINVLKHSGRINNVAEIFKDNKIQQALANETVLIIDDEADQASINNHGRYNSKQEDEDEKKVSSTYASILGLRNLLPGNSYVQYTATPQANILIDKMDILSPKTHTLLIPGKGYCGGKLFFGVGEEGLRFGSGLIKEIPEEEVFHSRKNALQEMPESLEQALMLHLWAVAINTRYYDNASQISMMVHTDVTLLWNSIFHDWIEAKLSEWSETLEFIEYGVKRYKLEEKLRKSFIEAIRFYDDSNLTYDVLREYLLDVLNDTHVYLITGETDDMQNLNWKHHTSNILVGAQMLNRGFTVKNLATTYMPRYTIGTTNADTIEQRCRFFGYKEKYIRSCRVFLPKISIENYKNYITSEEELRSIMAETKSIEQCGHKILSFSKLRPTRKNILPISAVNSTLSEMKSFSPYQNIQMMSKNVEIIDDFICNHSSSFVNFERDGYMATNYQGMRYHTSFRCDIDLAISLLKDIQLGDYIDIMRRADTIRYLLYLRESKLINDVVIVNMSNGLYKDRSLDDIKHALTSNLFNGPSKFGDKAAYIGDSNIYVSDTITIQLHHINFENKNNAKAASVAIYYPQTLAVQYTTTT